MPVASVLGGMDSEYALPAATHLDPDHGISGEPVMGVDHIKRAYVVFGLKYMVNERTAHVIDFGHEVAVQMKRAAMIVNAVNPFIPLLALPHACKHMNIVSFPLQGGRQLCDMDRHTAYGNGMESFPG